MFRSKQEEIDEQKAQDMSTAQTEEVQLKRFKDGMELLTKMTSAVVEQFEGITGNL